jgi:hypothetical protein
MGYWHDNLLGNEAHPFKINGEKNVNTLKKLGAIKKLGPRSPPKSLHKGSIKSHKLMLKAQKGGKECNK